MSQPEPLIFIAGPVRNTDPAAQRDNVEQAYRFAAHVLQTENVAVFCGPGNTERINPYLSHPMTLETALMLVRPVLRHCTAVYVLCIPGWEQSSGVKAEIAYAQSLNIPVHYYNVASNGYTRQ